MDPCTSYDVHVEAFRGAVSILSYVGTIETPPTVFHSAEDTSVAIHSVPTNINNATSDSG
ncbi:hypothetical protein EGR_10043 [Echinococcus granulosus]|uniref:Uncharacterized protein n=1 Tax=Echinococcus granulosus TaxID=6210 RepID=W6U3G7_ECHGR|nr:hypothetical protein EGR_10043 [Echinococcus granulosus]EUB55106.1 hypothetical protein EGR_10043 [Echinococcus granulosus]